MSKLIKTNNALLFLIGVFCAGLSWLSLSGLEHLAPGGASPFLHKLGILLAILCGIAALICLVLATQDSWQQLRQSDGGQPARTSPTRSLQSLLTSLSELYRLRKGVRLTELKWYVVLAPRGSGMDTLLHDAQIKPLDVEVGTKKNRLPAGCAWWGSSLEQSAPTPTSLMLAVDLDEYGRYSLAEPAPDQSAATADEEAQQLEKGWRAALRWLRSRSRFRGVIIAVSTEQLLREAEQDTGLGLRLRGLAESAVGELGRKLPVFVVINHCGRVAGFTEFFLDKEQGSDVVVGFDLDGEEPAHQKLDQKLEAWLQQLMERASERAAAARGLRDCRSALRFPVELARLRQPIDQFLQGLGAPFEASRRSFFYRREAVALRALYLTAGKSGSLIAAELPERLRPHIELTQDDAGSRPPGTRSPWLHFLHDTRQHASDRRGGAGELTQRAWLQGLGARLLVAAAAGLLFTALCGLTYGVKRARGLRLLDALQAMEKTPWSQRDQALPLLTPHGTLLLSLSQGTWDLLPEPESQRLLQVGARDFRERYIEAARREVPGFASSRRNELMCEDGFDAEKWRWELLRHVFLQSQPDAPAQLMQSALNRYKAHPEMIPSVSALDRVLREERDQLTRDKQQEKQTLVPDPDLAEKVAVGELREPALEMQRFFVFDGYLLFLKRAQGNCVRLGLYETQHAQAWSRWLRLFAQQRIYIAAPGGTRLRSASGYQQWLAQLRPQLVSPELSLGLTTDAAPRESSVSACQPLPAQMAAHSLQNTRMILESIKTELPAGLRILSAAIRPEAQGTTLKGPEQRSAARLVAPFAELHEIAAGRHPAMNKYLAALDKLVLALSEIEHNKLPVSKMPGLVDSGKDQSGPRAAFELLIRTRGLKGSELSALQDARAALIKSLQERQKGASSAGINALQDVLVNAEILVWEVLSRLSAEYARVRIRSFQTLTERARAAPIPDNYKLISSFFEQFIEGELELVLSQGAALPDYQQLSHRLILHVDEFKPFYNAARELTSQPVAPPAPPPVQTPPPAPATPAAPQPDPAAQAANASPAKPVRIVITNDEGCAAFRVLKGVMINLGGTQFRCPPGGECVTIGSGSSDSIELQAERVMVPVPIQIAPRTPRWLDEHACEGDRDRCFRVLMGQVGDQLRPLCQPVVAVYMNQSLRARPASPPRPAAPVEQPSQPKLEIPSWSKTLGNRCWMQWEAPDRSDVQ